MTILPVTKNRLLKIWWAHLWRLAVSLLCAQLVMAFIGFAAMAFILKLPMGSAVSKYVSFALHPVAVGLYLLYSVVPFSLILGKDFGEFRLVLVARDSK